MPVEKHPELIRGIFLDCCRCITNAGNSIFLCSVVRGDEGGIGLSTEVLKGAIQLDCSLEIVVSEVEEDKEKVDSAFPSCTLSPNLA